MHHRSHAGSGIAWAQDRGSAVEAKALLDKAVAYYKANGQPKAFAAFNDPKGAFVSKDLYIFALDMDGKILAHGANAALIGRDMMGAKDARREAVHEGNGRRGQG